jgi:hypothetical protein
MGCSSANFHGRKGRALLKVSLTGWRDGELDFEPTHSSGGSGGGAGAGTWLPQEGS